MEEKFPKRIMDDLASDLPRNWELRSLNELCKIKIGGTPKTNIKSFWNGSIKWATAKDISNTSGRFIQNTEKTITKEGSDRSAAKILPAYTIVITARGTVGKMAITPEPMAINQTCYGLLAENIDNMFLYYSVKSALEKLMAVSYGSVFNTITIRSFEDINLLVPNHRAEQRAVAKILSDLDSKIELNQRMNKTLEAIAQAIFKRWFIDFEFPNEEGKPYKSSGGEMVDSELGEIPKDWKLANFTEEFVVNMGQSPPGKSYNIEGRGEPFFQGRKDFGERFPSIRVYCNDPKKFASKGETLISVRAPVGDLNKALVDCCIGRGLASIKHASGSLSYTYYTMVSMKSGLKDFESKGTVFGSISKSDFGELNVIAPRTSIIQEFEKIIGAFDEMIELNTIQNRTLEAARDSLLPKLMSGRLRVPLED